MRALSLLPAAALTVTLGTAPALAQDTQEERDVGFIQGLIEDNLSGDNVTVRIEGFEGALSSRATVGELTVADADGVWLRATGLVLDWNRSALLRGRVEVSEMSAETITFVRAPDTAEAAQLPDAEAEPFVFALPDLPVAINIEEIIADRITLGEAFLGTEYAFSVDGGVSLEDGEGAVNIVAQRLDATVGSFEIAGTFSDETRVLALTLDLQEEADGLVAKALGIPGRPSLRLLLDGEAPIDDYAANLSIATDGTERIAGEFGLVTVTTEEGLSEQDLRLDITGDVSALIATDYGEFFGPSSRLAVQGARDASGAISLRALEVEAQAVQLTGSAEISPDGWPLLLDLEGRIAGPDGTPVLLPGAGPRTFVDSVLLDVTYDAAAGDVWDGTFTLENFSHPAVQIPELSLQGTGVIVPAGPDADGRFTADVQYAATELSLTDPALADAVGADISGRVAVARESDGPFAIEAITLTGPGVELDASGTVLGPADGFQSELTATLTAGNLGRFGTLTGLDLRGQAEVALAVMVRPLDGIFNLALDGTTDDLALGIAELDPLLAGAGIIDIVAARDTAGTRLERLDVTTDELTVTATADITSLGLDADFALDISDLGLSLDGLDGAARVRGTANTDIDGFTAIDATATLPGATAEIIATLPPSESAVPADIEVALDVADLEPFSPLAGRSLDGALDVMLIGTAAMDAGTFDIMVTGDSTDLAVGIPQADPFLAGETVLQGRFQRTGPLSLTVQDFALTSPTLSLTAAAQFDDGAGEATFALDIDDVAPAVPDLAGALSVDGTVARDAAGRVTTQVNGDGPGATVIDIDTTLEPDFAARADGTVQVGDLAPYSALAGQDLRGALDLTFSGSAGNVTQYATTAFNVVFDLAAENVVAGPRILNGTLEASGIANRDVDGALTLLANAAGPGGLALAVNGDMAARDEGGRLSGTVDLAAGDLGVYSSIVGAALSGSVDLTANGSTLPDYSVFDVTFDLSGADLSGFGYGLDGAIAAQGDAARDESGAATVDLTASGPGSLSIAVDATMASQAEGGALDGTLSANAADLSIYSDLAQTPLSGSVDLVASGSGKMDVSVFDVTFDLSGRDLSGFGYGLDGAIEADGRARRDANGALTADIDASGPGGLALSVDGNMAPASEGSTVTGAMTARADDLSVYSGLAGQPFTGALDVTAEGSLRPDLTQFDVAFDLSGRDLSGMGYALDGAIAANGTAARTPDGVTSIDAAATGPGGAAIDVDAVMASAADGGQISGAVDAQVADLSPYSNLAGRSLAGSIDAQLSGMAWPDLSGFDVDFDLTGSDLAAGGIALPGGLSASGQALRQSDGVTSITLDAQGPGGASIQLAAEGVDTVTVDLTAAVDSLSTYAGLIGQPLAGGVDARVRGTTQLDFSTFDLALDAQTRSIDVGVPAARPLLAGVGTINGQISRSADGTLRAQGLDVAFPAFSVSGNFDSEGGAGGGTFTARLNDVGLFTDTLSGPATADGTVRLQPGGGASVDIDATGPGGVRATVLGSVGPNGNLALNVNGQAPLDLANLFISPLTLSGTASVALSVNGPPALSSVTGTVTLADGRLFSPRLGRSLQDIGGTIQLTGGQAVLDVGAGLDAGGRLSITGPVGLTAPNIADIRVVADGLILRDPNLFETTANGVITVRGPLAGGAQMAGSIDIGETEIRVPSSGLSALGALPEVRHVGASPAVRQTLDRAGLTIAGVEASAGNGNGGAGPVYGIDIVIRAPSRIFIRGRGVDAELGGELMLTGTTAQIIPIGQFELVRGRVDILGQRFTLDEGGAYLQGDFVPFIRLVATTEAGDGTIVSIIIDGPADDPDVRFESQPDLPQDEVLARLLFGRDLSSISPLQAVQLAAAVSTLAGNGGGGLIDDFRAGVGLDDLDIVTDEDGGVGVRAGAYLSENVYTDVVVGTDNTEITLNLDLTDDITVTGSTGTDGDTSIGIFFERDY